MNPDFGVIGQKFAHCDMFEGSFLTILGVIKNWSVLFRSFFGVFWKCLGILLGLKGLVFCIKVTKVEPQTIYSAWGPAEALLNFNYAFAGLFIRKEKIPPPATQSKYHLILDGWVGGWVGRRIYLSKIWLGKKLMFFFIFLRMS